MNLGTLIAARPTLGGLGDVPGYCSWMPFSSFLAACKPPTPEQAIADAMANLGPAASPETVARLQTLWAETDAQQCAAHPDECDAYQFAISHPDLSAAIGAGTPAQVVANIADVFGNPMGNTGSYLLIGVAVLAGIWFLTRSR